MRLHAYFLIVGMPLLSIIALVATGSLNFIAQDLQVYRESGIYLWSGKNPYLLPPAIEYTSGLGIGYRTTLAFQIWTPPFSLFIPLLLALCSRLFQLASGLLHTAWRSIVDWPLIPHIGSADALLT